MEKVLYEISYKLHGEPRRFIIRTVPLTAGTAWHWVACDVGIGIIPRSHRDSTAPVTQAVATRFGITAVTWRRCDHVDVSHDIIVPKR